MASHRMALGVAPLFLRLALAVIFIWAGLGKLRATMPVEGEDAAILANMGVVATAAPSPDPATPSKPLPPGKEDAERDADTPAGNDSNVRASDWGAVARVSQDAGAPAGASPGAAPPTHTAADFPDPVQVKWVHGLALSLYHAAHPKAPDGATAPDPIWPPALASGRLPVIFAYLVVAAELGGGILVLIGLCTRLAAFSIAGTMAGAMWLTQIGPAIQKGDTRFGFLPNYDVWSPGDWTTPMFQFALFCAALALFCTGPGYMALDHALFGRRRRHEDHDGE